MSLLICSLFTQKNKRMISIGNDNYTSPIHQIQFERKIWKFFKDLITKKYHTIIPQRFIRFNHTSTIHQIQLGRKIWNFFKDLITKKNTIDFNVNIKALSGECYFNVVAT